MICIRAQYPPISVYLYLVSKRLRRAYMDPISKADPYINTRIQAVRGRNRKSSWL